MSDSEYPAKMEEDEEVQEEEEEEYNSKEKKETKEDKWERHHITDRTCIWHAFTGCTYTPTTKNSYKIWQNHCLRGVCWPVDVLNRNAKKCLLCDFICKDGRTRTIHLQQKHGTLKQACLLLK